MDPPNVWFGHADERRRVPRFRYQLAKDRDTGKIPSRLSASVRFLPPSFSWRGKEECGHREAHTLGRTA
jgi:hypothetical protein